MTLSAKLARYSLWLSLALVAWFAIAAFGPKFGLFSWKIGFGVMTAGWGIRLIAVAALVAVIALIATLLKPPRTGWVRALIALLIPAAFFGALASVQATAESVPPIHDVTTDLADPPMFSPATMATREAADANPIIDFQTKLGTSKMYATGRFAAVADKTKAQLITAAFPELHPVTMAVDPRDALAVAAAAMNKEGLHDVAIDEATSTVSGYAEILLYGFRDDVIARVRPDKAGGSVVDFRSTSRVGISDLGVNAKRVEALIKDVEAGK